MADSAEFKAAADQVRNLKKTPTNEDYAKLYSLFKQATCGDCDRSKPSAVNLLENGKYDAWISRKGMSKAEAAQKYIDGAKEAVAKYGQK